MKNFWKKSLALSLALTTLLSVPTIAHADWVQKGSQWTYTENGVSVQHGWKKINGSWYYFNNGIMQTGWLKDNGCWYFLQGSGAMKTGWLKNGGKWYYLNGSGAMKTGWLKSAGEWYFLNSDGVMQTSLIQVDGVTYDMGTDGKMKATTPAGYPYAAYSRNGSKTQMVLPKKNGQTVTVNLWEGMSLQKMAQRLNDKGVCPYEDFLTAANTLVPDFSFNSEIPGNVFYRYEGYLFPDTYEFYLYEDAATVVKKMLNNFEKKMTDSLLAQIKASGYSFHEVMTLASIVQGEAGDSATMKKVAQVYLNRLSNPATFPKLQANPTTNYARQVILSVKPSASASAASYDTYQCNGIPTGPINNPGLMAIEAVLNPDTTVDGYFFCTDSVTKEFYFAKTYAEHKENTVKAGLASK